MPSTNETAIHPIPLFADNYAFVAVRGADAAVVDPGDARPVLAALQRLGVRPTRILLTHHHADHAGGAEAVRAATGARLAGPDDVRLPGLDPSLRDGDRVSAGSLSLLALATPGHTRSHLCYVSPDAGAVFTGDTLFGGGCGRLIEGSADDLFASLRRLAALPADTRAYFGHEYTLDNLEFALIVEPDNAALRKRFEQARQAGAEGRPTVPSTIGLELATNPFLRTSQTAIRAALRMPRASDVEVFAELRRRKDDF